jgi:hypothetical protein
MHPVIIEALAAERVREDHARAAAAGRARRLRQARRPTPVPAILSALAGRWPLPRLLLHAHATDDAV